MDGVKQSDLVATLQHHVGVRFPPPRKVQGGFLLDAGSELCHRDLLALSGSQLGGGDIEGE